MKATSAQILAQLQSLANPANVAGMARYGINPHNTLGVSVWQLRRLAKEYGKDHLLALELWASGIHEARLLAAFIDDPAQVDEAQMESWAADFDSWDVCDQVCSNLFDRTPYAYQKAFAWSEREEEFVKRAGFVLMASLAVHDKKASDQTLEQFFPAIQREATDDRNFVKKAVNWALRNLGKRSHRLNQAAIAVAQSIAKLNSKASRWIARDTLRELTSSAVQKKLAKMPPATNNNSVERKESVNLDYN